MDDNVIRLQEQLKQVTESLKQVSDFQEKTFDKLDQNSIAIIEARHERAAINERYSKIELNVNGNHSRIKALETEMTILKEAISNIKTIKSTIWVIAALTSGIIAILGTLVYVFRGH